MNAQFFSLGFLASAFSAAVMLAAMAIIWKCWE